MILFRKQLTIQFFKPIVMPYEDMTVTVFRFIKRILSGSVSIFNAIFIVV
jgi:hypothetical protein